MNNFDLMEATIASVHAAMRAGNVTAEELISAYLDRIAAYEDAGPAINAIIMTNPQALTEAAELDRIFRETGEFSGPLHGIPVILQDNVETYDMPTTAGSK